MALAAEVQSSLLRQFLSPAVKRPDMIKRARSNIHQDHLAHSEQAMRPQPQPLHDCKTSPSRTSLRSGDTMGIGEGARPRQAQSAAQPHQGLPSVSLFFFFLFFLPTGLRSAEALSGGEPAELMMQQPGRNKGYDEHSGGLHYEH